MVKLRYELTCFIGGNPIILDYDPNNREIQATLSQMINNKELIAFVKAENIREMSAYLKFLELENLCLKEAMTDNERTYDMNTTKTTAAAKKKAPVKVKTKKKAVKTKGIGVALQTAKKAARKSVTKVTRAKKAN